jgi:hypothetical protein
VSESKGVERLCVGAVCGARPEGLKGQGASQGGKDRRIDMPSDMHQIDHHAAMGEKREAEVIGKCSDSMIRLRHEV